MNRITRTDIILSIITGVLYPVTFMIPYMSILAWVLLVPLLYALINKSGRDAFKLGLIAGAVSNMIGTYWLIGTLTRFGGFPLVVSFIFIVFLSIYGGLAVALFSLASARLHLHNRLGLLTAILIAAIWTSIEYLFPFLFPYTLANSQAVYLQLVQVFDLLGVYGLTFVIVLVNVAVLRMFLAFRDRTHMPVYEIATCIVLIISVLAYGYIRIGQVSAQIAQADKVKVGLVQANFDFLEKTESDESIVTARHKQMSREMEDVELIIWPETALQAWFPTYANYLSIREEIAVPDIEGKYFIVGGMSYTPPEDNTSEYIDENLTKYNTAFLTDSYGEIMGRYHKIELLLFGEYLPFTKYVPSLKKISPASGDFTPGSELNQFVIEELGLRIAPIICYEDIIPSYSRMFVDQDANLIVNITNDAWFGKTIAPYQHLLISIPRAIENRRYLIRSTNTGISAIIDPLGRVVEKTDIFTRTNLVGEVALMNGNKTLYTRIGYLFPMLCLLIWVGYVALRLLRRKRSPYGF